MMMAAAPARAKERAIERPIPRDAPVMSTWRPLWLAEAMKG